MLVGRAYGAMPATSLPSITIVPDVGVSKPPIDRNNVVLPQPDGPSSEKNSPRRMSSDTFFSTGVVSNVFQTSRTLTEIGVWESSATAAGISVLTFGIVTVCHSKAFRKTVAACISSPRRAGTPAQDASNSIKPT